MQGLLGARVVKVRNAYVGSTRRMDAETALQKAEEMKSEVLRIQW